METNNRILIVDDMEAIHQDFRKILQPRGPRDQAVAAVEAWLFEDVAVEETEAPSVPEQGYELAFASQAKEALDQIEVAESAGTPFAIVFTDVRMPPGLDGVALVERILKLAPYTEIVIVTAYSDYSWEELTEKFGWTDRLLILRKPFDGITIKQIASTLTRKWALAAEARHLAAQMTVNLTDLERKVEERTAKLAAAYKELQNFAYIVSHDLRSPLVSIRGFVSELRFDLEKVLTAVEVLLPNLDEEQQDSLRITLQENIPEAMDFIDTSTTKMDRLIKGILKLARLGHRKFSFEDVDLAEIVDHHVKVLSYPLETKVDVEVGPMPTIHSDRLAMDQIIGNLLSNAVKYLKPGQAGKVTVSCVEDEDKITVHIKDNGRGISHNAQITVFEIFQRGDRHEDVPGEGMGLTYTKTLVQRLGGRITVSSELEQGSTFTFHLPKEPPRQDQE